MISSALLNAALYIGAERGQELAALQIELTVPELKFEIRSNCPIEFRSAKIKPVCDGGNVSRRLLGADVCGLAGAGAQGSRDRLWYAFGHGNRADVCVCAWMAGKCVS